ncbi:MAG: hypothetical protein NTX03_10000 [Bacteroidetes bacterium]|nr:hypothetical protein [Bacteroidota bacterium]
MDFKELFGNAAIKSKQKTDTIIKWILVNPKEIDKLLEFAYLAKDSTKATCIEALELATIISPQRATQACWDFVVKSLTEKAPRIKWESAKVIGNTAHLFPKNLDEAIKNLVANTAHTGTVVRWSAAYALSQIMKLKTKHNEELITLAKAICAGEEKNSIKKIYLAALK